MIIMWKYILLISILQLPLLEGSRPGSSTRRPQLTNDVEGDATIQRRPARVDPHGSWMSFVRHDETTRRQAKATRLRAKKGRDRLDKSQCEPGPPGPPGPAGPAGALVTEEVLMKEFRQLVRDEVERRILQHEECPGCPKNRSATWHVMDTDDVHAIPRVTSGFHHRLRGNMVVQSRTFLEVKNFHRPFGGGAFQRGGVFSAAEGRFTAPRDGIYHLTANMHTAHDGSGRRRSRKLRRKENIRILICIMSLCQKHTSLEFISGLESNSRKFTVSVSGLLHLEMGHYASVYIENSSNNPVTILEGSDFSGVLIGV